MMRPTIHHFVRPDYRNGPFVLTLTDLHQSNIFVDDDWHITSLIDLEWAYALPIELQCPPYWLSGRAVDDIEHGEPLQVFSEVITEFIDCFEEQEKEKPGASVPQAAIMRECWRRGSFWYFQAVNSPKGLFRVFNEHIQRTFCEDHCTKRVFDQVVSPCWAVGAQEVIQQKIKEEVEYKNRLRERFAESSKSTSQ